MVNTVRYLETILVVLNCIIWLGPLTISIKRRSTSLLHPTSMFPFFVMLSILVAMTEHWFGWSGRDVVYGLRIETRTYLDPYFFIKPLAIVLCAGCFYHYGVMIGCGRLIPGNIDRLHLDSGIKTVGQKYTFQLFLMSVIIGIICIIPFAAFGQNKGFFWTTALIYAFNFIPVMLVRQDFIKGLIFLFGGFLIIGIRGSKGDFIYYILPIVIFYQETFIFKKSKRLKIILNRVLITVLLLVITFIGTIKLIERTGVIIVGSGPGYHLLTREYGFEVFSILVKERSPVGDIINGSWLFSELVEALPSALGIKKKFMGHEVARIFLPRDFEKLPRAGFSRFFLFSFYYDLGWLGALTGSLFLGLVWGCLYKKAIVSSLREENVWPMFVYLPLQVYAGLIANGAISYALIHIIIAASVIKAISRLATLKIAG